MNRLKNVVQWLALTMIALSTGLAITMYNERCPKEEYIIPLLNIVTYGTVLIVMKKKETE